MAALQKIRNKGALLIGAIGLALFAFIAEEFFRALETTSNVNKQQIGEVYGEKLSVQDYQILVDEASEIYKLQYGNLNDQMQDRVRDEVWNQFVSYKLFEHEADKLGLTVTDEEMQNALREGTAGSLRQLQVLSRIGLPLFEQNGRFSVQALQEFLKQYNEIKAQAGQMNPEVFEAFEIANKIWLYTEKLLRQELLMTKFQGLFQQAFISNPVAAKMIFDATTTQSNVELAAVPFSSVEDKEITVSDSDLKAMYDKNKELFRMLLETRDVKYIDVLVTASTADRIALEEKMNASCNRLKNGEDAALVVSSSNSLANYVNAPLTKNAFANDVRVRLDTMGVGATLAPYYNGIDNTFNVIKLVNKVQAPDSMLIRQIAVVGESLEEMQTRADSVYNALKGGADFKALAQIYGQPGDSLWITSAQYESDGAMDENGAKYVTALNMTPANSYAKVDMGQANVVVQVLERKAMQTKYNAAVIKCPVDFSTKTYGEALNKFNRFIAENRTIEDIEKNAVKSGYFLRPIDNFVSSAHNVANVGGTKDAVRWIFDEAEVGSISKLYECGDKNDHLLLVAMTAVHEAGLRPWNDPMVKEVLESMVKSEKKGELLMQKLAGVKDMAAAAQQKGAVVDTLENVTFTNTPFVAAAGVPEPVLSGAVAKTENGSYCGPLQGAEGIYMFRVLARNGNGSSYDEAQCKDMDAQAALRMASAQLFQVLAQEGEVIDNRYKF